MDDTVVLSGKDICAIIKEASKSKVVRFEYNGLVIDFQTRVNEPTEVEQECVVYDTSIVGPENVEVEEIDDDYENMRDPDRFMKSQEEALFT